MDKRRKTQKLLIYEYCLNQKYITYFLSTEVCSPSFQNRVPCLRKHLGRARNMRMVSSIQAWGTLADLDAPSRENTGSLWTNFWGRCMLADRDEPRSRVGWFEPHSFIDLFDNLTNWFRFHSRICNGAFSYASWLTPLAMKRKEKFRFCLLKSHFYHSYVRKSIKIENRTKAWKYSWEGIVKNHPQPQDGLRFRLSVLLQQVNQHFEIKGLTFSKDHLHPVASSSSHYAWVLSLQQASFKFWPWVSYKLGPFNVARKATLNSFETKVDMGELIYFRNIVLRNKPMVTIGFQAI